VPKEPFIVAIRPVPLAGTAVLPCCPAQEAVNLPKKAENIVQISYFITSVDKKAKRNGFVLRPVSIT
jgi:hypothetical protein